MSQVQALDALSFPLQGSRLIEASAGTGKTYTLAALYLRLVLGHGNAPDDSTASANTNAGTGFSRPLLPPEILVVTFTRAATAELRDWTIRRRRSLLLAHRV
uniref:UvrD-helicase domain-containing protein n=1 Tax=Rheinheimera sp. TaxID=1869214 RepID=UPI00404730E0